VNEAELDRKLKQGKEEAGHFFAAAAVLRENRAAASRVSRLRPRTRLRMAGAFALAALIVAAALFAVGALRSGTGYTADGSAKDQTVCLGEDRQYRVSSIPVNMPDDAGLITVLWEMHGAVRTRWLTTASLRRATWLTPPRRFCSPARATACC
jgi:hypothetical protein